ncbi:unnamed protein product [Calypogeia fissa]
MGLEGNFQSCIEIYLRLGPIIEGAVAEYTLNHDQSTVEWLVPRQPAAGMTNHQRDKYNFSFTGILGTDTKQDIVFDTVARKVVLGALDGYNGTIFAYGQTGSGKTYTITGSAERYVDRGLIPRALSLIFSELAERSDHIYQFHFAYLEIYNEIGYDLLNPHHETKSLEDLPKVTMLEDGENCFHLRNLSQHLATTEEEALNLLFVGETNRMISATPMNLASSRSHCIFTVTIEARKAGQETVRRSKLHLVDLAGSERVWKNGIDGQVLKEAKFINLSLHFLEQVIIALHERTLGKARHHIPYRNSMMTSVLRDSIGGNSLTVMVATVTIAQQQLEETISTCRFAQRVALVSNQVTLNEEIDLNFLIKRLKQEIKVMKEELRLLRGDQELGPLTSNELANLRCQINKYLADSLSDASLDCGGNIAQIHAAFQMLKEMVKNLEDKGSNLTNEEMDVPLRDKSGKLISSVRSMSLLETISYLNYQVQQRENEINILISFIRTGEKGTLTACASTQAPDNLSGTCFSIVQDLKFLGEHESDVEANLCGVQNRVKNSPLFNEVVKGSSQLQQLCLRSRPEDRRAAFELFRSNYPRWDDIEENKRILKAKYTEAKVLGEQVNKARGRINEIKAEIGKCRVDRAIESLLRKEKSLGSENDHREEDLISIIEKEKVNQLAPS